MVVLLQYYEPLFDKSRTPSLRTKNWRICGLSLEIKHQRRPEVSKIGLVERMKCGTARCTSSRVSNPSGLIIDLADRDRQIHPSYLALILSHFLICFGVLSGLSSQVAMAEEWFIDQQPQDSAPSLHTDPMM
ncbi:hypothetical protein CC77DRAFT_265120 [Alternaria alternata]|jgi:hypothetical protein|uniref:Uncharacterized protein n=1 Tax=Alternaria alternata TaxID=5599 RepID=A0A177DCW0_ALTAL|nr:hypothetical protein CC77DRAFT_265120 [Alternaria alternata]OAG17614.1 hypothetical protein CC77DRAFT_265120 [Alternaria alternata]